MDLHNVSPRSLAFVEAGVELGWLRNDDCNGASQEGFGIRQVTQRAGKRESTADCYLRPALHRPNLTVITEALVARVLFEGSQAVGVAYLKDGGEQQIRAHNEVILSGGTINSPQLLMLSGIGPAEHLRTFNIPVVVDLPGVGYNLQDHPCIYISYKIDQPGSLYTGGEGNAYIKSRPELPEPDMQMLFTPSLLSGEQGYTFNAVLPTPQSHGHLELRSTDPTQYPAIFANYLEKQNDLQRLVESVKLARRLASTKAFAPFGGVEVEPGPQVQSDQEIVAFIRKRQSTMFHPVGTCKMGRDEMAVVDEELRVHGVHGLRVIDASIMPTIVNGNTNAPTIMIAEKGADLISGNIHFTSATLL
jgi:choline dehydrogenase